MQTITTKTQKFSYDTDKILRVRVFENSEINLADAEEGFTIANQLTQGEKHFVLIDIRNCKHFSLDAKNHIAKEKENRNRIAEAFIVNSNVNRLASNFYFSMNKPSVPTMLFINEEEAINWFESMLYLVDSENKKK